MELHFERLTLRLSGLSERQARRLAELVGQRLASARPPDSGGGTDQMHVSLTARHGESLDALAQRIAAEVLLSVTRTLP